LRTLQSLAWLFGCVAACGCIVVSSASADVACCFVIPYVEESASACAQYPEWNIPDIPGEYHGWYQDYPKPGWGLPIPVAFADEDICVQNFCAIFPQSTTGIYFFNPTNDPWIDVPAGKTAICTGWGTRVCTHRETHWLFALMLGYPVPIPMGSCQECSTCFIDLMTSHITVTVQ